jgi:lysyl-tRNA synthetase class 2
MENKSDLLQKRRAKFDELRKSNINLFPNDFRVSHNIQEIRKRIADSAKSLTDNDPLFAVAGRIMAINRFGRSAFIRFRDRTGQLQAYLQQDRIGDERSDRR